MSIRRHLFRWVSDFRQPNLQLPEVPWYECTPVYLTSPTVRHLCCFQLFFFFFPFYKQLRDNILEQTPLNTSLFVPKNSTAESQTTHIFELSIHHCHPALHKVAPVEQLAHLPTPHVRICSPPHLVQQPTCPFTPDSSTWVKQ